MSCNGTRLPGRGGSPPRAASPSSEAAGGPGAGTGDGGPYNSALNFQNNTRTLGGFAGLVTVTGISLRGPRQARAPAARHQRFDGGGPTATVGQHWDVSAPCTVAGLVPVPRDAGSAYEGSASRVPASPSAKEPEDQGG